jgi:hypothetical protein
LSKKILETDKIVERAGGAIQPADYQRFVKPYDNAKILKDLRKELRKCK